jgi:hypothetical protein
VSLQKVGDVGRRVVVAGQCRDQLGEGSHARLVVTPFPLPSGEVSSQVLGDAGRELAARAA